VGGRQPPLCPHFGGGTPVSQRYPSPSKVPPRRSGAILATWDEPTRRKTGALDRFGGLGRTAEPKDASVSQEPNYGDLPGGRATCSPCRLSARTQTRHRVRAARIADCGAAPAHRRSFVAVRRSLWHSVQWVPIPAPITEHRYRVCDICHVKAATVFTTGPSGASLHSWLQ